MTQATPPPRENSVELHAYDGVTFKLGDETEAVRDAGAIGGGEGGTEPVTKRQSGSMRRFRLTLSPARLQQLIVNTVSRRQDRSCMFELREKCPVWAFLAVLVSALVITYIKFRVLTHWSNEFAAGLFISVCGLTMIIIGDGLVYAFVVTLAMFAALRIVDPYVVLHGFAKEGVWVPQLILIIVRAIRESGVLEETMGAILLFRRAADASQKQLCAFLYFGIFFLAIMLGAGPTITIATPFVTRWAKTNNVDKRLALMLTVTAATCGSTVLTTSAEISISILHIICEPHKRRGSSALMHQTRLVLALSATLAIYAIWVGPIIWRHRDRRGSPANALSSELNPDVLERSENERGDNTHMAPTLSTLNLFDCGFPYSVDFLVDQLSILIGQTAADAGLAEDEGIRIFMVSRYEEDMLSRSSRASSSWSSQASTPDAIKHWVFDKGDMISARCSAVGVAAMRRRPGVFVVRPLHCTDRMGGRRSQRQLYECAVSNTSSVLDRTLEELIGSPDDENNVFMHRHRGYPLAAWRRVGSDSRPISSSRDILLPADVLLVEAFPDFQLSKEAREDFLIVSAVPDSHVPRHGRFIDRVRGIIAMVCLVICVILAVLKVYPLVMSGLVTVVFLVLIGAIHVQNLQDCLNVSLLLTIGAGMGVSEALYRTHVSTSLRDALNMWWKNRPVVLNMFILSFVGQLGANFLSPVAAGLIIAPIAQGIVGQQAEYCGYGCQDLAVNLIVSCNMALSTSFATPAHVYVSRVGGFTRKDFLQFGVGAQLITTAFVMMWSQVFYMYPEGSLTIEYRFPSSTTTTDMPSASANVDGMHFNDLG